MHQEISAQENVDKLEVGDKTIYLVGTAHISQKSVELAEEMIRTIKPDSVAVELCNSRYESLKNPDRWKNTDIISVIKEGKAYVLLAQIMIAGFQKKLGDQLKVKPGAEMLRSAKVAEEVGANIVLADREVKTTLKRTWSNLGLWGMCKLVFTMFQGLLLDKKIDEAEIERLKSSDALEEMMAEFSKALPGVRTALIDERDSYLAEKIKHSPGKTVVAVIGAGHIPGIKREIFKEIDLSKLEVIPPKKIIWRVLGWALPLTFVALIAYGFFKSGANSSIAMLEAWFWFTGLSAGLGALLAFAHPVTILCAVGVTPLTSLHPMIAAGWVTGLVEAMLHKPRVSDFETVGEDVVTLKGFWRNRISRILLVVALTNFFGGIGKLFALGKVASLAIK